MHLVDWLIMIVPLLACGFVAVYSRRFVRGVADFMAGGRAAGRYLVCAARSEQGSGAVCYVATFQVMLASGFTTNWFGQIATPIGLLVMISGFVIYRYRQTRAMTLGQFFETRYSRKFRLFAGVLGFLAGLVNFGVIPVIGAQFMVFFLQLPLAYSIFGVHVPTYLMLMAFFLSLCVIMTTSGGQISVLLTDCAEGIISQLFYTFISIALIVVFFKWADMRAVLVAAEPGKSLVNPFDTSEAKDFNIWYIMIGIVLSNYRTMAWQNSHAFNSCAATPHEARMGGVLGRWRWFANNTMAVLLAVCAMMYLKSADGTAAVNAALNTVSDPATRDQMLAPVALTQMLPIGVKGALLSICFMGILAGDGIHLHSWGSIFIQDVVMPLRKKPLSPKQHIRLLRLSILGVALWAFAFGALFPQIRYVALWWGVTEALFVSGAGVAIIAGLYWARGTTAGAWAGLCLGTLLAAIGISIELFIERTTSTVLPGLHQLLINLRLEHVLPNGTAEFTLNGAWVAFIASMSAIGIYCLVSWLTCRHPHNMDKLLHRGQYSVTGDVDPIVSTEKRSLLYRIFMFGIDEQFTRTDKWITVGITAWAMFWFLVFGAGSIAYLIHPWSDDIWADYWIWSFIYLPLIIGAGTTVWFTWGCSHDMVIFFRRLKAEQVDVHDDGSVSNQDEKVAVSAEVAEL